MDMTMAKERLTQAAVKARELSAPAGAIYGKLGEIQQIVNEVRAAGYQPNTMTPLMIFMNEVMEQDKHQRSRYASLLAGIERVIGRRI